MNSNDEKITYFAETDSRGQRIKFGIKQEDRSRHVYVIGKTGMGKSTLLENMAVQDIQGGEGMAFIDPHGKTADLLLEYVPKERMKDVLYFAPFDLENPVSFNVMEDVGYDKRHLVVSGLMSTFKKIWQDAWSARMEYILSNTLLALLEYPGATLLSVNKMLSDKVYRKKVVDNITDPSVKAYWTEEFAGYTDRFAAEATPAIQNKIGQFTSNPLIRNVIGQAKSSFNLREMMDNKKIIIINLSKGRVGEVNANLLGSMLITKIYLAAMSRADVSGVEHAKLAPFYLYVDEFQSFANESFADILSEARKYKLALTIAHQYIEQMSDEVRAAVFGNVGTMISFRVGAYDAETLEKEFAPKFTAEDIVNLGFVQIYLKLMIDGVSSQPFSARTLPPIEKAPEASKDEVIRVSREQFAKPRKEVEDAIQVSLHDPVMQKNKESFSKKVDNKNSHKYVQAPVGNKSTVHISAPKGTRAFNTKENSFIQKKKEVTPVPPSPGEVVRNPFKDLIIQKNGHIEIKQKKDCVQPQHSVKNSVVTDTPKKKSIDKGPSKEKKNELKDVLASLVQKKTDVALPNKQEVKGKEIFSVEKKEMKTESLHKKNLDISKKDSVGASESSQRKEVPEHELRKILGKR